MNFKIGSKTVGDDQPCFVIAEAGSNHNGRLSQAKKLVDVAAKAGADAVKFQTFSAEKLFSEKYAPNAVKTLKKFELTRSQHEKLFAYTKKRGLIFLSSPFDEESADMLEEIGVPAFKIASYELTHIPLLKHVARKKKPVILSTGMATAAEIKEAVSAIKSAGNKKIILMHCVSKYPTDPADVNLKKIASMKKRFRLPVGYSDHTEGSIASIAAAAMGANVIEKHFTLNRKLKGPDHFYALEPDELEEMIDGIRLVEKYAGEGLIKPAKSEIPERAWRRSIYAKVDISKGARIRKEMLSILRPVKGAKPKHVYKIIGKKARKDIKAGSHVTRGHVWEKK